MQELFQCVAVASPALLHRRLQAGPSTSPTASPSTTSPPAPNVTTSSPTNAHHLQHTSATTSPRAVVGRPCSCHSLHRGVSVPDDPPRERTHRLAECSASGGVYAMQSPARETAHEHMVQQHREKTWHQRYLAEVRYPGRKRGWGGTERRFGAC